MTLIIIGLYSCCSFPIFLLQNNDVTFIAFSDRIFTETLTKCAILAHIP